MKLSCHIAVNNSYVKLIAILICMKYTNFAWIWTACINEIVHYVLLYIKTIVHKKHYVFFPHLSLYFHLS